MEFGKSAKELFLWLLVIVKFAGVALAFYYGTLTFEHINDTYHDTHVICLQVTHHSHSCK